MILFRIILVVILLITFVGCDRAKVDFERCIQLEQQNNPKGAFNACKQAAKADPNSKSGQAAAYKAAQLLPSMIKLEQEKDAAERAARVTPEQKAAQQAALNQRMQKLRAKIHRSTTFSTEDDHCAAEGKPGHSYRYGGGTYSEDEAVAQADGCVPFDDHSMGSLGNAQNHFCCP